ncbi:MAG: alpha/beta fold hydrolase [Isosphaeraceae bacterium]|nr:alpha/beta fold hydrolase [Isosphaeraceae bacterium]
MPFISTTAGELYFDDLGAGAPVVFIPGLGGDARAFAVIARALSSDHRTIVFDPRDAGRSFRATSPYSTADAALDIAEALERLELGRVVLVGHSLGGLIAQELTLSRPDLVGRLVLASSHAGSNTWRRAVIASWIALRSRVEPEAFTRMTLPWLVAPDFYHHTTQIEGLIRFAARNEWPQTPDAFERQATSAMRHDARGRLAAIRVPTLVLSGGFDLVNPVPIARALADEIPGARLEVIEAAGHMPHIETGPEFKNRLAAFLAERP